MPLMICPDRNPPVNIPHNAAGWTSLPTLSPISIIRFYAPSASLTPALISHIPISSHSLNQRKCFFVAQNYMLPAG